jgi:type III secretion system chaperone SycN
MTDAIESFLAYAGLSGFPMDEHGRVSMRMESGSKITIETDSGNDDVLVSVFHPSPWKLLETGMEALRAVHYKRSEGWAIAAGILGDRLVLSTRLPPSRQSPQDIERATRHLCALAEECTRNAGQSGACVQ